MSYILDALNKSEQERKANQTPDLSTIHRAPVPSGSRDANSHRWFFAIIAIIIVNAAGYWFWLTQSGQQNATAIANSPAVPASTPPRQFKSPDVQPPDEAAASVPITNHTSAALAAPVRITDLPREVQSRIPALRFSSHLFSEDAEFRMVNINGQMIREGNIVADGIRLLSITEDGVILTFQNYSIEVSVLQDWTFPPDQARQNQ